MKKSNKLLRLFGSDWGQRIMLLVVIMAVMAVLEPRFFLGKNVLSILLAISYYGIMACGMLFCVMVGGIDLSIGSMAALSGTVFALTVSGLGESPACFALAIALGLLAGVIVGFIHGFFDVCLQMPAFVVTYATQYALYGLAQELSGSQFIRFSNTEGLLYKLGNARLFGIQTPIIFFIVIAFITAVIMRKTPFGRRLYAVGGNRRAASLVGINTKLHTIAAYIICSVSAGLAGIVLCSMNMVSQYNTARGYEGPVMMALVVGGIDLAGGSGSVGGVIFGALLVGIIKNVLILVGINTDYNELVQGVIILLAVALNVYANRRAQGLAGNRTKALRRLADAAVK